MRHSVFRTQNPQNPTFRRQFEISFEFDSYESIIYACLFPNIAKEQPDVLDIYLNPSDALNFDGRSLSARKLPGLNTCPRGFRVGKELFDREVSSLLRVI